MLSNNFSFKDKKDLTKHLLDDGGHEEGDGDHGGGQEDEGQGGARHHEAGGPLVSLALAKARSDHGVNGD